MRRAYYFLAALLLMVAVVVWLWPSLWEKPVMITISEIFQRDGRNWATVSFENRPSQSIFYEGIKGTPQCHFSEYTKEGVITDSAPHVDGADWSKAPELPPGASVTFPVELRLGSRGSPIAEPFKIGIKLRNSLNPPQSNPARNIPVVGRWLPTGERLLWTAESRVK